MAKVLVEVSARHVHVTDAQVETLFGPGYKLTVKKELSQPGQFVSNERVRVIGPKGELKCSILGPARSAAQVEISLTDARAIGVEAAIRESGCIEGTNGVKLIGPAGEVDLKEGLIAAKRHVHLDPKTAEEFGVKSGDEVSIKVGANDRNLVFGDVVVRVSEKFAPAVHLDTDEGNAAGLTGSVEGELIK